MKRMVRKQIYVEPEQEALLKRRAEELGLTESELIRRGIDQLAGLRGALPWDREAWEREIAFMRARTESSPVGGGREWSRQDLYEDRLGRLSR